MKAPNRYAKTSMKWLRRFMEFPRKSVLAKRIQGKLIRVATEITRWRQPDFNTLKALSRRPLLNWLRIGTIALAFSIGLIHASITVIASAEAINDGTGTTLDTSTSLNLATGDCVAVSCKHEGTADGTSSVAEDGGGNACTKGTVVNHANGDLNGFFAYNLNCTADAAAVFRLTTASRAFRAIIVYQFRPDAGDVVTLDAQNTGQGTSTTPASGTITTTGTDEIAFGMYCQYANITLSSRQINGVAADAFEDASTSDFSVWYRILTATFSGGNASASQTPTDAWICNTIAFKSEAAAETVLPPRPTLILNAVRHAANW